MSSILIKLTKVMEFHVWCAKENYGLLCSVACLREVFLWLSVGVVVLHQFS